MRISDWSSDVCSSDREQGRGHAVPEIFARRAAIFLRRLRRRLADREVEAEADRTLARQPRALLDRGVELVGRHQPDGRGFENAYAVDRKSTRLNSSH